MHGRYERSFPNLKSRHSLDASDSFPIVCGSANLAGPQTLSLHSSSRLVGRRRSAIGVEKDLRRSRAMSREDLAALKDYGSV